MKILDPYFLNILLPLRFFFEVSCTILSIKLRDDLNFGFFERQVSIFLALILIFKCCLQSIYRRVWLLPDWFPDILWIRF